MIICVPQSSEIKGSFSTIFTAELSGTSHLSQLKTTEKLGLDDMIFFRAKAGELRNLMALEVKVYSKSHGLCLGRGRDWLLFDLGCSKEIPKISFKVICLLSS